MFTPQSRTALQEQLLRFARADERITGGALTGSIANDTEDRWSDIDLAFGVAENIELDDVMRDWTAALAKDLNVVHHFDLRAGSAIYRVFLLADGLEVDIGLWPAAEFGAAGPKYKLEFGRSVQRPPTSPPPVDHLIGLCWHHALHAHAAIERAKPWLAEFWIGELRNNLLSLACIREGLPAVYARGTDDLPAAVTAPYLEMLVGSLDREQLRLALARATDALLQELALANADLAARLRPVINSVVLDLPDHSRTS
ncbi:MAG TPA: hypothetical protein VFF60_09680 [Candidatus Binatus sp.]|nr:hypothetical protein [Candidatus Binatus sp.]